MELFVKVGIDDQASKGVEDVSKKMKDGLAKAAKLGEAAVMATGAAIAGLVKKSIDAYGEFEQLSGGADLMFGDAYNTVMQNASNAYKTVQMSQNEYLRQVNGFATGLKTALGGNEQAAAELSDRIVKAEADIVAATGNTAENVQNAFNGIMKSNFTMLDNLQIGIKPTKEGFQEVIDKVNDWNEENGRATNYQMDNLADMQSALVDYIDMIEMSGYAQAEAAGTIQGSAASMKSAFEDFLTSLADSSQDSGEKFNNLKETAFAFFDNIKPKIKEVLSQMSPLVTVVGSLVTAIFTLKTAMTISTIIDTAVKSFQAYKAANEGATIAQWAMNAAMNANPIVLIVTLIAGLVSALVILWNTNDDFKNALISAWDAIKNAAVSVWEGITKFFTEDIPNAFNSVINFVKENWQSLLLLISNPIAGALKLLYDLNPKFKEWVDGLWQKFKDLINSAKTWGKDLIDNFVQGIKDKIQKVKDTVKNVAQTVKDFLGFSEPKKGPLSNFHTYAPDMIDLFTKGVKDNENKLTAQIEKTFNFGKLGSFENAEFGIATAQPMSSGASLSGATSKTEVVISIDDSQNLMGFARALLPMLKVAEKEVYV